LTNSSSSRQEAVNRGQSNRFEARGGERLGRAGGWSMRTHRKYVEERDEEERWVRPAGSRGGPERRQHERCVVYHRHLRDIHRREGLQRPATSSARSCPVQGRPTPRSRYCSLSLSLFSFSRRATGGTPCEHYYA